MASRTVTEQEVTVAQGNIEEVDNEINRLSDSINKGNTLLKKIEEMNNWIRAFSKFGPHLKKLDRNDLMAQEIRDKLVSETQELRNYEQMKIEILGRFYLGRDM